MFKKVKNFLSKRIREYSQMSNDISALNDKMEYLFWILSMEQKGLSLEETKKQVFLDLPKATGELRKTQLINNFILNRIKDICDRNGIEFFLYAGTLLGGVRHKGFIPWDDDIDIAMMHDQYNKFCDAVSSDELIHVEKYYNNGGEMYIKVKLKESETFWVDIFLFEYISVSPSENITDKWQDVLKINEEYQCQIKNLINEKFSNDDWSYPHSSKIIDREIEKYEKDIANQFVNSGDDKQRICFSPLTPNWIINHRTHIYEVEKLLPLELNCIVFENECYSVMKNYESFLKMDYGDYMNFPKDMKPFHSYEQKNVNAEADFIIKKYGIREKDRGDIVKNN